MSNFNKCLEIVLHHEGGYVNHPKDPGGMTNMGVTKRVYEEWVGYSVSENTMQNLKEEDVAPIYKNNYWDRVKGDQLPNGLDLVVFDFGVNAGTGRAAKFLQAMIGTVADGGIGPNTLAKLDEFINNNTLTETIRLYQDERQDYYESLSTFNTFGKGWTRRVNETTEFALEMAE
jgi:lysozyme family protein